MPDVVAHSKLTHDGALKLLQAGIAKAQQMGVPQCIESLAGRLTSNRASRTVPRHSGSTPR